ncbi:glutaredoxin family protein [Salinarchaeum sp. IM2453]|uniref:glutaredoxin family protein n=1 Tax=Salinarchaeum sp. IM2453 TaxID=2862870 RepID=UPI001C82BE54|nr:glutaredoxin family protein [Salinarchaeum sp. IM2453]QZA88120.1 glutaredoxin family protein [Salinarchaeum sp. IM2453]
MGQSHNIELYQLDGCPHCIKVKRALNDLKIEYESNRVPRSPDERDKVMRLSGQREVPVLVDRANDVKGLNGSDEIVEYLYETYGDGEPDPSGLLDRFIYKLF